MSVFREFGCSYSSLSAATLSFECIRFQRNDMIEHSDRNIFKSVRQYF